MRPSRIEELPSFDEPVELPFRPAQWIRDATIDPPVFGTRFSCDEPLPARNVDVFSARVDPDAVRHEGEVGARGSEHRAIKSDGGPNSGAVLADQPSFRQHRERGRDSNRVGRRDVDDQLRMEPKGHRELRRRLATMNGACMERGASEAANLIFAGFRSHEGAPFDPMQTVGVRRQRPFVEPVDQVLHLFIRPSGDRSDVHRFATRRDGLEGLPHVFSRRDDVGLDAESLARAHDRPARIVQLADDLSAHDERKTLETSHLQ